jgi:hypothetical protein
MGNKDWQIKTKEGKVYGPVETETLRQWIKEKRILAEDSVWNEEKKAWIPIKSVSQFSSLFGERVPMEEEAKTPEVKPPEAQATSSEGGSGPDIPDDKSILTFQLIADAWRAMLAKGIWSIIGVLIVMGFVSMAGSIAAEFIPFVGFFVQMIISASLALGWAAYTLKVARREGSVGVGTIFEGFSGSYIWQALGAMLLMWILPSLAGLITLGIWGIYLSLAYTQTYFFVYDENRGPWEGMKSSFDATKGFKWRIIAVQVVCMFLGMLFLGIGLIVTMPLANIAIASLYYRIRTGRISPQHAHTSFAEYIIVIIPILLMLGIVAAVFFTIVMEQMPLIMQQMEQALQNLPR